MRLYPKRSRYFVLQANFMDLLLEQDFVMLLVVIVIATEMLSSKHCHLVSLTNVS